MREYFSDPADPKPGDFFHLSYGCMHFDGEVCWVERAANAAGKLGHVVIWRDERGAMHRTLWSTFREHARRVDRPQKQHAIPEALLPACHGLDAEVAMRLGWIYRPNLKDWEAAYPGKYDHLRRVAFENEPERQTHWFEPARRSEGVDWHERPLPRFSYRLEDATTIVDAWNGDFELRRQNDQWRATFFRPSEEFEEWADAAPLAICRAFLNAPAPTLFAKPEALPAPATGGER